MSEEDAALVMCVRTDERDKAIVPGSIIKPCRCGAEVWVAQSTFTKTDGLELVLCCEQCITDEERDEFASYLADVLQELIDRA